MQRISITNPQNIIDGTAKKYYFKLRNTGGPKGDKGDKGDTGATGPQGPQGDPCTVIVNSTATLEPGSDAYVTNTGSLSNAVLNFGIPKGDRGPQGAKGDKGDTGAQGETGPRGPQGERGTNATVSIGTTYTLNPGSQATVYNSGSDSNAVLNFGIPQGAKGDTGSQGPQGPTGPAGQNFAPTVVTELPETGDSSKLYLTPKAHTTSTATGNPITASVAEEAGQMESFQLDGDTFQQTYTGKNLLGIPDISATSSGVEVSVNNGVISCVGTVTSSWGFNIASGTSVAVFPTALPAGNYAVSINKAVDIPIKVVFVDSESQPIGTAAINAGNTSATFTTSREAAKATVWSNAAQNTQVNISGLQVMVESGSTATTFEPYVGGVPSPNPEYPQQIQTVTGEQKVEIVGKNLFDKNTSTPGLLNGDGTIGGSDDYSTSDFIQVTPDTTYYKTQTTSARFKFYDINKTPISSVYDDIPNAAYAQSFTTPSSCYYIRFSFRNIAKDSIQIEKGSTGSSYAPYYKQTLPLDLGSIELCKLGTYQDYIWKDGEDWKVHKETGSDSASNRAWEWANISPNGWYFAHTNYGYYDINKINVISKSFIGVKRSVAPNTSGTFITIAGDGSIGIRNPNITGSSNVTQFTNWLNSLNTTWLYAITTPTDTTITDTNLIAQLEAIRTASLENGANTITNSTAAPNLAGDMEIGYYGYNPTNRYDKWLWLDLNNNYEQIGS